MKDIRDIAKGAIKIMAAIGFFVFGCIIVTIIMLMLNGCVLINSVSSGEINELIVETNNARKIHGMHELAHNDLLMEAAHIHAKDPASFSGHTGSDNSSPYDRVVRVGYNPQSVRENIFWTTGLSTQPKSVIDAWLDSPGHRKNFLADDITEIGISFVIHDESKKMFVAVYGDRLR